MEASIYALLVGLRSGPERLCGADDKKEEKQK